MERASDMSSTRLYPGLDACPQCGKRTSPGQKFCVNCGNRLPPPSGEFKAPPAAGVVRKASSVVASELARHTVSQTPRTLQFLLGIALRAAGRHEKAVEALHHALKEPGVEPPAEDIFLQLAYIYELTGAREQELRSYLEAVRAAPRWADQILPQLHRLISPELAPALAGWFAADWETAFADPNIDAPDRLHAELFLCRVQLNSGNYEAARTVLDRIRMKEPGQFDALVPSLFTADSLRAAVPAEKKGDSLFALAQIAWYLHQPQALSLADEALELGLDGGKNAEAPVHQLRGEILEATRQPADAALAFYEAGRRYFWRNELATADALFARARKLRPDHAPTLWFSMEAHRVLSYRDEYPNVDRERVEASLRDWEAGIRIEEPGAAFNWAYSSRALLNEQLASLPNADGTTLNWEAVALLERSALHLDLDAYGWAYLGRFHRYLMNQSTAGQASEQAVKVDPKNAAALEERATILSEIGHATEALEFLAKRRAVDDTSSIWLDAVEAYNLLLSGPHERVLELLDKAVDSSPTNLWYLALRASCHRLMGQWSLAAADTGRVWNLFDPNDASNRGRFAWAAAHLGNYPAARGLFEKQMQDPVQAAGAHRGLGFCALAQGDVDEAAGHLRTTIALSKDLRDLDELEISDFAAARHAAADGPHAAAVEALLTELKEAVGKRRAVVEKRPNPATELDKVIRELKSRGDTNGWAWIGAQASFARLHGEASMWSDAAEIYELLLPEETRFPEARRGIARAIENLIDDAADSLSTGHADHSHESLIRARELLRTPNLDVPPEWLLNLSARSGMAAFVLGEHDAASSGFREFLAQSRSGDTNAGTNLARACRPFVRTASQYWALRDAWLQAANAPETTPLDRADLQTAATALAPALDTACGLTDTAGADKRLPVMTPVVLEIGDALIPHVDPSKDGGKFLYTEIPAMRQRIEAAMGLKVPGVRARPFSGVAAPDAYRIQLDEVTVTEGSASEPSTLIGELEAALSTHASMFLGVQEADTLLTEWQKTPEGAAILPSLVGDQERRLRLMRLLRSLLAEQIPIARSVDILQAVRDAGLEDPERALRAVRLRLRARSDPGAGPARTREVPADWQRWIQNDDGRVTFTASPADAHRALTLIRTWMSEADPPDVLITSSQELRRFVRQLVAADFPHLSVLAAEELPASGGSPPAAAIAATERARSNA